MGNEIYIGAPDGIVLCVDGLNSKGCCGRIYHAYSREAISFFSLGEMLFQMDYFFDSLDFPRRSNNIRYFTDVHNNSAPKEVFERVMTDQELLEYHGKQDTFIVRVQHRQNNTWQGRITWADKNKTLTFRSIWEMVHLMENAIYEDAKPEEIPQIESWEE